jgi:hypothetical protein
MINGFFYSLISSVRYGNKDDRFFSILPEGCYLLDKLENMTPGGWLSFMEDIRCWMAVGGRDKYFVIEGEKVDLFGSQLDTAIALGNDQLKFAARLHGQCEVHCYIEGQNREWLAGIIEQGLEQGIYRREQGWESVVSLLRNGCNSPVVLSYSVCDQFPSEDDWDKAMDDLRSPDLELNPESLASQHFSDWNAFKIDAFLSGVLSDANI